MNDKRIKVEGELHWLDRNIEDLLTAIRYPDQRRDLELAVLQVKHAFTDLCHAIEALSPMADAIKRPLTMTTDRTDARFSSYRGCVADLKEWELPEGCPRADLSQHLAESAASVFGYDDKTQSLWWVCAGPEHALSVGRIRDIPGDQAEQIRRFVNRKGTADAFIDGDAYSESIFAIAREVFGLRGDSGLRVVAP